MVEVEIEDWPRPIFQPTFRPISLAVPFEKAQSLCLDDERDFSFPRADPRKSQIA
jgi:hypothetical protein